MRCCLEGWEDGQPVKAWVEELDREQTQRAEHITIELRPDVRVIIHQKPEALTGRLGVGACIWDGALVLTAYLTSLPPDALQGKRCVELGAGVGLVGLAMARLGAHVVLTDKPNMLSLLLGNIARNWLRPGARRPGTAATDASGTAEVAALEWGIGEFLQTATSLATPPLDWVLMSDCIYVDPVTGQAIPSDDLMDTAARLCSPQTVCLLAFEVRSVDLREPLLEAAFAKFDVVDQVEQVEKGFRGPHIELYRLAHPRTS